MEALINPVSTYANEYKRAIGNAIIETRE